MLRWGVFDANCRLLADLLARGKFERLLYVSSTRVYMNQDSAVEGDDLKVCSDDQRRLFNPDQISIRRTVLEKWP